MTDEEMAEEYAEKNKKIYGSDEYADITDYISIKEAYLAGLKAGKPKWHKVADGDLPKGGEYGENNIHRNIYIKDRYGNLYTGNYFPKDKTHAEDCFAVEFLEWGFQGSQFCKKAQISEWCEIPQYTEE
jgi:hypothetical protein